MEICVCHFLLQVRVSMGTERKREDEFDLYLKKTILGIPNSELMGRAIE